MIKKIFLKYKEVLLYVLFGVLTTLVNFIAFGAFSYILGDNFYLISNAIAWIISVVFAYITNKLFVFNSKSLAPKILLKEFSQFLVVRIFSFVIEEFGMWLFIDILGFDTYSFEKFGFKITGQIITKILLAVIVIIINYFFSKFLIFRKKSK